MLITTAPSFTGIPQAFMHHLEQVVVLHCSCYSFLVVELLVDWNSNRERERGHMQIQYMLLLLYGYMVIWEWDAALTRILTLMRAGFHSDVNLEPIRQ